MDEVPPFKGQPTATDPPITITLSLSGWHTVAEHVRRGICNEVYDVLTLMYLQMEPQLEVIERERKMAEQKTSSGDPAPTDDLTGDVLKFPDLVGATRTRSIN